MKPSPSAIRSRVGELAGLVLLAAALAAPFQAGAQPAPTPPAKPASSATPPPQAPETVDNAPQGPARAGNSDGPPATRGNAAPLVPVQATPPGGLQPASTAHRPSDPAKAPGDALQTDAMVDQGSQAGQDIAAQPVQPVIQVRPFVPSAPAEAGAAKAGNAAQPASPARVVRSLISELRKGGRSPLAPTSSASMHDTTLKKAMDTAALATGSTQTPMPDAGAKKVTAAVTQVGKPELPSETGGVDDPLADIAVESDDPLVGL